MFPFDDVIMHEYTNQEACGDETLMYDNQP